MAHCPNCGGQLKIIAAILEQPVIEKHHAPGFAGQSAHAGAWLQAA